MGSNEVAGEGRIISLKEAAQILGVSYPTAHRMACDGELKAFRLRNVWRTSTTACEECVKHAFAEQARICQSVEEK